MNTNKEKVLKIGFCGPGGSGKGTLGKYLAEHLDDALLIPSQVQKIGSLMFPNIDNFKELFRQNVSTATKEKYQYSILTPQIALEDFFAQNPMGKRILISERSLFDYLAYEAMAYRYQPLRPYKEYEEFVLETVKKSPYQLIFFLSPSDFEPGDKDGAGSWKERDEKDRQKTYEFLQEFFSKHPELPCKELKGMSFEEKANTCMEEIKRLLSE